MSSNPGSPVASLFSARAHNRFPSSVPSLASSPAFGATADASVPTKLEGVKEDPLELEYSLVDEDNYFPDFNEIHADDSDGRVCYERGYDLSDEFGDMSRSLKKRRPDASSLRGISRISSRISSISTRWKQKPVSDAAAALEKYDESLRSRANSATSALATPLASSFSARHSQASNSPARTIFEENLVEAGISPIDIDKANRECVEEREPQATTPLLPPVMMDLVSSDTEELIQSPLQSPTVAEATDTPTDSPIDVQRSNGLLSPPLSTQPSLASISRQLAASRAYGSEMSPITMLSAEDEWSCKLGHANFTIHPMPYTPEEYTLDSFEEHRNNWSLARRNYAKHLVRTGEHYGLTSNIYRSTEEKWDSIDTQWRTNHNVMLTKLTDSDGKPLSLSKSSTYPGESVKMPPYLDKNKFPDLGDEDIVGPMSVAPAQPQPPSHSRKRSFFKFLQDIFSSRH
ncbi:hypothetical protein LOZ12_005536 [Ophidiomyces ophidiicola]|uniref:uncharacterized protein n=1 Tax=Ophidiomyces ophidiicola TaxID=1387563 RepID=UPI0020C44CE3|nr:uncharacterized protein LOZ57_005855 [Ophidiomyces ophidiicola]KAI1936401.1 hypothetical protein LOZ62_005720 [Ophidiomyces ophidiicola]KAI1940920.1 hypothetical protein LOZ57_005855 [Ophidiomyces ophidiicola]KAI1950194.1 hypothetical protein LOZ59_005848 [Ophidiomyces ophidiicola]KAI1965687.1 hypothetical protein LOZ56_006001 [Ophidiomyces ophidiicola]KAI2017729.1 hypothetical protein LOZ45_006175 [Ophidiomyces ophidiicola]